MQCFGHDYALNDKVDVALSHMDGLPIVEAFERGKLVAVQRDQVRKAEKHIPSISTVKFPVDLEGRRCRGDSIVDVLPTCLLLVPVADNASSCKFKLFMLELSKTK